MSKLLFKMRNVPDDEAQEVRDLLEKNNIEYFETHAGNWGISLPAIWLQEDSQFEEARKLLDVYESERGERIRQEYVQMRQRGEARTLRQNFSEDPIRFIMYMSLAAAVLFISVNFFLSF